MARSTGARSSRYERIMHWPGGEHVWWPAHPQSTLQQSSPGVRASSTGNAATNGSTNGQTSGQTNGQTNGKINGATAGATTGVTNGAPGTAVERTPVLLYLHGGGFIACSPETHRPLVSSLVRRLGGEAFVPSYRLAPEHPHPAALEDAENAYLHLVEDRGVDPSRIIIAGDSAGGGLALALTMSLRDHGIPLPAGVVLFSPWTDMTGTGASLDENSDRCAMFAGVTIRRAAQFYVGEGDPSNPMLSPLFGDFHGLPPLLLHASEDEVLRDDTLRVAERAREAGVTVTARLWPHVPHVWQFFAAVLPEARESLADATAFVRDVVGQHDRSPGRERE